MSTTATQLAEVNAAISALTTGGHSSYSIGSRSVSRLALSDLFGERKRLEAKLGHESGASIRLAKMVRPSR